MSEPRVVNMPLNQLWAIFGLSAAALLTTGVQPILLGTLLESRFLGLAEAGYLATIETVAIAVGVLVATSAFPLSRFRQIALIATVGLAAANVLSVISPDVFFLGGARILSGFSAGVLLWIVTSVVVRTIRPAAISGYYLAGQTLVQSLAVIILAIYIVPQFGWRGCYGVLAVAVIVSMLGFRNVPVQLPGLPEREGSRGALSAPVILVAALVVLQIIATITIWAFLEPIGRLTGAGQQAIQVAISVALLVQILGASAGAVSTSKFSPSGVHLLTTAILGGIAVAVLNAGQLNTTTFIVIVLAFSFLWMFMLPFQVSLAMQADESGRLALQMPALQILGAAIAPTAAGLVAGDGPASGVALLSLYCAVLAFLVLLILSALRIDSRKIR